MSSPHQAPYIIQTSPHHSNSHDNDEFLENFSPLDDNENEMLDILDQVTPPLQFLPTSIHPTSPLTPLTTPVTLSNFDPTSPEIECDKNISNPVNTHKYDDLFASSSEDEEDHPGYYINHTLPSHSENPQLNTSPLRESLSQSQNQDEEMFPNNNSNTDTEEINDVDIQNINLDPIHWLPPISEFAHEERKHGAYAKYVFALLNWCKSLVGTTNEPNPTGILHPSARISREQVLYMIEFYVTKWCKPGSNHSACPLVLMYVNMRHKWNTPSQLEHEGDDDHWNGLLPKHVTPQIIYDSFTEELGIIDSIFFIAISAKYISRNDETPEQKQLLLRIHDILRRLHELMRLATLYLHCALPTIVLDDVVLPINRSYNRLGVNAQELFANGKSLEKNNQNKYGLHPTLCNVLDYWQPSVHLLPSYAFKKLEEEQSAHSAEGSTTGNGNTHHSNAAVGTDSLDAMGFLDLMEEGSKKNDSGKGSAGVNSTALVTKREKLLFQSNLLDLIALHGYVLYKKKLAESVFTPNNKHALAIKEIIKYEGGDLNLVLSELISQQNLNYMKDQYLSGTWDKAIQSILKFPDPRLPVVNEKDRYQFSFSDCVYRFGESFTVQEYSDPLLKRGAISANYIDQPMLPEIKELLVQWKIIGKKDETPYIELKKQVDTLTHSQLQLQYKECVDYLLDKRNFRFAKEIIVSLSCPTFDDCIQCQVDKKFEWIDVPHEKLRANVKDYDTIRAGFEEMLFWMIGFVGQRFFERLQFEEFGVILWLYGESSTGKSGILNAITSMYADCDVGHIPDNIEKDFGLESLCDKLALIAGEITSKFGLPQALLQQIATDPIISINRKFKDRLNAAFRAYLSCASNVVMNYQDNSGSVIRRFLVFYFSKSWPSEYRISQELFKARMTRDRPRLFLRFTLAYMIMVKYVDKATIWDMVPRRFISMRDDISRRQHGLRRFFAESLDIVVDLTPRLERERFYISETKFKEYFDAFCISNKIQGCHTWSEEYFGSVFREHKIERKACYLPKEPGGVVEYNFYLFNCYETKTAQCNLNDMKLFLETNDTFEIVRPGSTTGNSLPFVVDTEVQCAFYDYLIPFKKTCSVWDPYLYKQLAYNLGVNITTQNVSSSTSCNVNNNNGASVPGFKANAPNNGATSSSYSTRIIWQGLKHKPPAPIFNLDLNDLQDLDESSHSNQDTPFTLVVNTPPCNDSQTPQFNDNTKIPHPTVSNPVSKPVSNNDLVIIKPNQIIDDPIEDSDSESDNVTISRNLAKRRKVNNHVLSPIITSSVKSTSSKISLKSIPPGTNTPPFGVLGLSPMVPHSSPSPAFSPALSVTSTSSAKSSTSSTKRKRLSTQK